ncbi:MAG: polyprenyl synthetase family protein [Bacteroidetes bacterium]|nr:polyprenyl synthetase family protein [Bacteroidota bacterium]
MNANIKKYNLLYEKERKKINAILHGTVKNRKPSSLYIPAAYIINSEGKRIRPFLVLLSAGAVGGNFSQAYNAAVAVELLHDFTLVHDDIMDNAEKRRGKLTLHKKYNKNTAILVGDSLLSVAYEYLLKDCNGYSKSIISSFTSGLIEVCEGQILDTDYEARKYVSLSEYLLMIKKKTASMVKMCCEIGATLGGGTEKEIKGIANYGLNIGIAFQVQDDLLDIIADENKFGKRIGSDLIEGKKTYLFIKALEKARGEDRKLLSKVVDNKGIGINQVKKYKELYERLGVIADARKTINYYTKKALNSLNVIKKISDKEILVWLADELLKRIR